MSQLELDYDDDVIIESEPPPKRIKSRQGTGGERPRNAIRNSLATPTRLPREETIYLHSDEEDLIPDTTGLRSLRSPAPLTPAPTDTRLPLDPGIIRAETVDRHSSRRYILKFDPTRPRPEYALKPRFGHLPGLYVGKKWHYRIGASWDGTHAPSVAGISGKVGFGVYSIALSGGYEDDIDEGYRFVYTGSGGRNLKAQSIRGAFVDDRVLMSIGKICGLGHRPKIKIGINAIVP